MSEVVSLLIGKKNSTAIPGKNWMLMNGKPACEYGFIAGKSDPRISRHYVSTDSPEIKSIGEEYGYSLIDRPKELATPESLTEDVLVHAHERIKEEGDYEIMVLLIANNPAINRSLMSEAITKLDNHPHADSVFSVCRYNMFSPIRARKIENGIIENFVDMKVFGNKASSLRDEQGDVYFCDLSIQVIRARVFEDVGSGNLPFKWQGNVSLPVYNDFGFDIDEPWQRHVLEYWLKENW